MYSYSTGTRTDNTDAVETVNNSEIEETVSENVSNVKTEAVEPVTKGNTITFNIE